MLERSLTFLISPFLPLQCLWIDLIGVEFDHANLTTVHVDEAIGHGGDTGVGADHGCGGAKFWVDLL